MNPASGRKSSCAQYRCDWKLLLLLVRRNTDRGWRTNDLHVVLGYKVQDVAELKIKAFGEGAATSFAPFASVATTAAGLDGRRILQGSKGVDLVEQGEQELIVQVQFVRC